MARNAQMTRSHFELIAATIKSLRGDPCNLSKAQADAIATEFRRALKATNQNFDGMRFEQACGNFDQ